MRVALVSNFLPGPGRGGAERYAGMLASGLAERGHEVTLFAGDDGAVPGVTCERLPGMPELEANATGARTVLWHAREQWLPTVHQVLRRRLRAIRPDVVHSHEPQLLSAGVFTAIAAERLPHVHTAHDFNLLCARVTMTRDGRFCGGSCTSCRIQRTVRVGALRRRLDTLIAPSDFVRDRHVAYGVVAPEHAVTIRHGAEAGSRRVRRPQPGLLRVGYLGALAAHKGVLTLLHAAARMPARWTLALAGGGPLAASVREAAARDPRIVPHGELDAAGRDAFLDGLDVLVIPSEWEEPATLVAVEAAVRGLPIVVSDRGGLPETPYAGIFPAGDAAALLAALHELADDPEALARCSEVLLEANGAFAWSTHLDRVERQLARAGERR